MQFERKLNKEDTENKSLSCNPVSNWKNFKPQELLRAEVDLEIKKSEEEVQKINSSHNLAQNTPSIIKGDAQILD